LELHDGAPQLNALVEHVLHLKRVGFTG
jgi:hypothetical protein